MKVYKLGCVALFIVMMAAGCSNPNRPVYMNKKAAVEDRVEDLLARMTLEEKVDQLSGEGFDTRANVRLGIPTLRMADGPAGVRWGQATAFPAPISMAATWDEDLLFRIGQVTAREMRSKGRNFFLSPCINLHRHPLGGRNFESFGEDPYLTSRMAVPFIKGVQSQGVLACAKHYAMNNQEWERHRVDVDISERALREIYLPHFKASVQEAGVKTVMAAYNVFRGDHCSESAHLLNRILKEEWGFKGFVVSDWGSVYSTAKAANNGLDLEMPYGEFFGDSLLAAVQRGEVEESVIDEKVRRLMRVRFESGIFDRTDKVDASVIHRKAHKALAQEAAEKSIVLLKNEADVLPLDRKAIKTIAVIGPNAARARTGGGGSSQVVPTDSVSALEGLKTLLGDDVEILFAPGVAAEGDVLPLPVDFVQTADGQPGWNAEYFADTALKGEPVLSRIDALIDFIWGYDAPHPSLHAENDENRFSVRWSGRLTAPGTGQYAIRLVNNDGVRVFVNGEKIIDRWGNHPTAVHGGSVPLTAGQAVDIVVEYMFDGGISEVTLGWEGPGTASIQDAVEIAKKADAVLVFSGLSNRFESESYDRPRMDLPRQAALIRAVAAANPKTIVINQSGGLMLMRDWINAVPAVLQAGYPGQEGGHAMARMLFGAVNPSGKLPYSLIASRDQTPAFKGYKDSSLKCYYDEELFVGYRYLDREGLQPSFAFGHGLSYTAFEYSDLKLEMTEEDSVVVSFVLRNTGQREGAEVAQIYVHDAACRVVRPEKELKAFRRITLKPGERKRVAVTLEKEAFAFYDEAKAAWVVEPGAFELRVGGASDDLPLKAEVLL